MTASLTWIAGSLRGALRVAEATGPRRLSVLIFHRVLPNWDPLLPAEPHAASFDRLMALVARGFRVLKLGEAVDALRAGALPARALTITFDDGYADNAEIALPILQRHGLAATFFVATGFLDGGRMFNDTVIECVRATRREALDLHELGLGSRSTASIAERRALIDELLPRVKYLSLAEREDFLRRLLRAAGEPTLPEPAMMRSEQVVQLHRAGMEIGGHTVNHPILKLLPDGEAEREILQGRQRLQSLVDAPVEVFAYPNGQPDKDYDARHAWMVRQLGFRAAVTTAAGTARPGADPFELPRFTPWDGAPWRWAARLMHCRLRGPTPLTAS